MKRKLIALIIICTMLVGCGSSSKENDATISELTSKIEALEKENEKLKSDNVGIVSVDAEVEEIEEVEEIAKIPTVGEYIKGNTWKMSLLDAKTYSSIEENSYVDTPADGKEYLVLFFEVENVSEEDYDFSYYYLESYIDSYSIDTTFIINNVDGYKTLVGSVASGKKLKGCLVYEVEKDWKEFEISYKGSVASSGIDSTFLVTPDNLTE